MHHSAGSTFDTNYTAVVRSYYLLHTEVNGWDDIGYNYLIARDGSIFAGRDPQNRTGVAQDNVHGAHFCGKNDYTMGICVIGDFTSQAPAAEAPKKEEPENKQASLRSRVIRLAASRPELRAALLPLLK